MGTTRSQVRPSPIHTASRAKRRVKKRSQASKTSPGTTIVRPIAAITIAMVVFSNPKWRIAATARGTASSIAIRAGRRPRGVASAGTSPPSWVQCQGWVMAEGRGPRSGDRPGPDPGAGA